MQYSRVRSQGGLMFWALNTPVGRIYAKKYIVYLLQSLIIEGLNEFIAVYIMFQNRDDAHSIGPMRL